MDELESLLASTQDSLTHYIEKEVQRRLEVRVSACVRLADSYYRATF